MRRSTLSLATGFALALSVGFAGACMGSAQKGHATIFKCHEGRIVSAHVPLAENVDIEDFKECPDGGCVPPGEACPEPVAKPEGGM